MADILEERAYLEERVRSAFNAGGDITAEVDALAKNSAYLRAAVALAEAVATLGPNGSPWEAYTGALKAFRPSKAALDAATAPRPS